MGVDKQGLGESVVAVATDVGGMEDGIEGIVEVGAGAGEEVNEIVIRLMIDSYILQEEDA